MAMYLCGGGSDLKWLKVVDFNFTESVTDSLRGSVATLSNVTRDTNGLNFTAASSYVDFDSFIDNFNVYPYMAYEIDVGNYSLTAGSTAFNNYFILFNTSSSNLGIGMNNSNKWVMWTNSTASVINGADGIDFFKNKTIRIETLDNKNYKIYADGNLLDTKTFANPALLRLGHTTKSCQGMIIKAMRFYVKNV